MNVFNELGLQRVSVEDYLKRFHPHNSVPPSVLNALKNVIVCYKHGVDAPVIRSGLYNISDCISRLPKIINTAPIKQLCHVIGDAASKVLFQGCYLFMELESGSFYGINNDAILNYLNSYQQSRQFPVSAAVNSVYTSNVEHSNNTNLSSSVHTRTTDTNHKRVTMKAYEHNHFIDIKAILHCSDMKEKWKKKHMLDPKNMHDVSDLVNSILNQDVGAVPQKPEFPENSKRKLCDIIRTFHNRHKRIHYKKLLILKARKLSTVSGLNGSIHSSHKKNMGKPFTNKQVYSFLCAALRKTVPLEFFGKSKNRSLFFKNVKRLCKMSPHHSISLGMMMHKMQIKTVLWLKDMREFELRKTAFSKAILWLFKEYVMKLIASIFYVIEKRGETFFYWKRKYSNLVSTYLKETKKLQRITEHQADILSKKNFAIGNLRLIPKGNGGLRPIQYMSERRVDKGTALKCLQLLKQINKKYRMKSLHTNLEDVWDDIWQSWNDASRPQLYFVHTDIMDAFGSVGHKRMLYILKEVKKNTLIFGEKLCFRKYKRVKKGKNGLLINICYQFDEFPFVVPKNCVLLDMRNVCFVNAASLFDVIMKYVEIQLLCWQSKYYYVLEGLPQGGMLSAELCDLYYISMDCRYLNSMVKPDDYLLRFVDDYLFITKSASRAERFLTKMNDGFPDYNCCVDKTKTETNLVDGTRYVTFCGTVIDTKNMSLSGNYLIYKDVDVAHTLKLKNIKNPGKFLITQKKVLTALMIKPLYVNEKFNSESVVVKNVFYAALLSAYRFHAIIRVLNFDLSQVNQKFLMKAIITFAKTLARRVTRNCQADSVLTVDVVQWLMFRAYQLKLDLHATKYKHLLHGVRCLCHKIGRSLEPGVLSLLKDVTRKGLSGVFETMV